MTMITLKTVFASALCISTFEFRRVCCPSASPSVKTKNRFKKHEDGLCEPYNSIEKINIRKIGVPDGEEKKL